QDADQHIGQPGAEGAHGFGGQFVEMKLDELTAKPMSTSGSQARKVLMGLAVRSSSFIPTLPSRSLGHSLASAKSHGCLGTRKPLRAAKVTMARPIRPPSSEGNSGPRKMPVKA